MEGQLGGGVSSLVMKDKQDEKRERERESFKGIILSEILFN